MLFQNHEVVIIRRARRKRMSLQIRPHEPLRVLTDMSTSEKEILHFLMREHDWIEKTVRKYSQTPKIQATAGLEGESWMLLGKRLKLVYHITPLDKPFVSWLDPRDQNEVLVFWPHETLQKRSAAKALELLLKTRKEIAFDYLKKKTLFWAQKMKLHPKELRLMKSKTMWGSCSSKGLLKFNEKLIGAPENVIDSIVVHELAHLVHMNHSKKFWDLVSQFDSHYKTSRQWLKLNQYLL